MENVLRKWSRSLLLTAEFSATIFVGIGSASALVSLMLALGYQPLPFHDSGRLVAVWERVEPGGKIAAISGPDIADFTEASHDTFATFGAFAAPQLWLIDPKGAAEIRTCYIQASTLSDLGIHPLIGRGVRPEDEHLENSSTAPAWISQELWQRRYGGSPSVIGTTVAISESAAGYQPTRVNIVGVLPAKVGIPLPFMENTTDLWYLLPANISSRSRQAAVFFGLGRLRPGVTAGQAEAALTVVAQRLEKTYSFDRGKRPVVQKLEDIAHEPAQRTLGLLVTGEGLVFLAACVNIAMLMGVEGRRRRRELAVRSALGASRWHLWKDVAAEKCLLTLLSLGLGIAFAAALLRVLTRFAPAAGLGPPLGQVPPLNLTVLLGFAGFSLGAAAVWSALVVRAAEGQQPSRTLAASGDGLGYTGSRDSSRGARSWRLVLLGAQAGIGICVLAAASLTTGAYATLSAVNLGTDPRHTVLLSVRPRDNFILPTARADEFNQQLLSRLQLLPGTEAIALADEFPPMGSPVAFSRQGDADDVERTAAAPMPVSPSYFRTFGIQMLFGRGFENDNRNTERVAIISLDMAQHNWPLPEMAVGSEISFGSKSKFRVVGVAADFGGYWYQKPVPTVYVPVEQMDGWCEEVILRTSAPLKTVASLIPQALARMATPVTISGFSTMQQHWQATLTRPLARMAGMLLLALLGFGLSVQSTYAVAAITAASRAHELAVCAALGAHPRRLAWSATRELVVAVLAGSGCGIIVTLFLRRLLEQWLGSVAVLEAKSIAAAIVLLAVAAALGCYVPMRAAMRSNPVEILRQG